MADKRKSPPLAAGEVVKRVRQGNEGTLTQTQRRTSSLSSSIISLQGAHAAEILDVKFSPDGQTIAAVSADHTVSLWETYGGNRNIGQLISHGRAVTTVAWAPAEETPTLVSGSADNTVIVWNARTGEKLRRFRGHKGIVNSVACTRSGRTLVASGSDDGRVLLWDLDERHAVDALDLGYPVTAVAFSEDGTQLFVGGVDNAIHAVDLATKQRPYSLRGHLDTIGSLALSRSGTHLLSSSLDDTLRIWDVRPFAPEPRPGDTESPRLYRTLTGAPSGFENILMKAAWSMDGERVASGSADRTCTIWEYVATTDLSVEKGAILYKLPGHRGTCTAVDMHPREPIGTFAMLMQSSRRRPTSIPPPPLAMSQPAQAAPKPPPKDAAPLASSGPPAKAVAPVRNAPAWHITLSKLQITRSMHELGIRFDCTTNMPSFYRREFHNVERTYRELAMYASALSMTGPNLIVPALPLPTPAMIHMPDAGYDEDVRELHELRNMLERWFERILNEPTLRAHKETRRFIESEYSYEPLPVEAEAPDGQRKQVAKATAQVQSLAHVFSGELFGPEPSTSGVASMLGIRAHPKPPPAALVPVHLAAVSAVGVSDSHEDLATARIELTRLEKQLGDVVQASVRVSEARSAVHAAMQDVADAFLPLATLEEARGESLQGRLPRTLRSAHTMYTNVGTLSDTIEVTLKDAMAYQELNLRTARLVLQERTSVILEHDIARRVTANKRQDAEQLRTARQLRPDRVEVAVEEVREAQHHEQLLERYLNQISQSLRESLQRHSIQTHQDLQHLILEHVRISGVYEQRVLEMLGLFDMDLSAAAQDAQKAAMAKANIKRKITPAQAAAARALKGNQAQEAEAPATAPTSATSITPQPPALDEPDEGNGMEEEANKIEPATSSLAEPRAALDAPEPSPWAEESQLPPPAPEDPTTGVWAADADNLDTHSRTPLQAPPASDEWSAPFADSEGMASADSTASTERATTHVQPDAAPVAPEPTPSEGPPRSSLVQSRLSTGRRRFGGLSAADAAKSLGGMF